MPDFDQMRADRVRWLAEIARVEAGNEPTVTHKELGELLEQPEEYVATLKRWVADNERHLADNNEPFDA